MTLPKLEVPKAAIALWVIASILAISSGAYAVFQDVSSLSKTQEKPAPQAQNEPQTRDDSTMLDEPNTDSSDSAERRTPPNGMQAPVGGHSMGAPPDAPPLKDVKQP